MAKTTAERQAACRERRYDGDDGGYRRLNMWIGCGARYALRRLAKRYCVTQREMIGKLIAMEDERIREGMDRGGPEWDAYYDA